MKTKKILIGLTLGLMLIAGVSCSPRSKTMEAIKGKDGVFALIQTKKGDILIELFYKDVPLTVTNFVGLAEGTLDAAKGKKFYNGLTFHRVITNSNGDGQDFMIQGGDPEGTGRGGPGYKFADEFVEKYNFDEPGMLAMANSGKDTNGSQFFITVAPTQWLTGKHTIFGKVVAGLDVAKDSIKTDDIMTSVTIIRQGKDAEAFKATQKDFDNLKVQIEKANKEAAEKAFNELVKDCEKTANGIYFKIIEEGKGAVAGKNKDVTVEYIGYLPDGMIFDASRGFHPQGHEPLDFKTASGMMIPGFDQMVQEMKYGETRMIVIPPELAYGDIGVPQAGISGGTYICFNVKLVK